MRQNAPEGTYRDVSLLGVALAISASHGRLWNSIIVAVLTAPGLGLIVALAVLHARGHQ
jgi:hypothetical protein